MAAETSGNRSGERAAPDVLRDHFLGWQCRIRQHAVRSEGGRPAPGMRPRLEIEADEPVAERLIVLIVEKEPQAYTARFQHIMRATSDPQRRYETLLNLLSADYFQHPSNFSDAMTALFAPGSATADSLVRLKRCLLHFEQSSQSYRLPCGVKSLKTDDPAFQATFWHNSFFNPNLASDVQVLSFRPDWARAVASPPVV